MFLLFKFITTCPTLYFFFNPLWLWKSVVYIFQFSTLWCNNVLSPFSMLIMCILSHILNLCYHQYIVSSSLVFLSFFLWTPTDFTKVFQDSWYTQLLQRLLSFFDLFNYFYKCFKSMTYAANLRLCILNNIFYHCLSFEWQCQWIKNSKFKCFSFNTFRIITPFKRASNNAAKK